MTDGPADLRTDQPHSARMYDYYLGGKDNYEADRIAADKVKQVWPSVVIAARANRDFMGRATRYLAEQGVRQFLDIGTGIPTRPNLHQIAQSVAPESRVVYVDNDPLVLAHARALLTSTPEGRTAYIAADVKTPDRIVTAPDLLKTLDMSAPVALSMLALLPFVPGEDAYRITAELMAALAPGSYLVLTHLTADFDPEGVAGTIRVYREGGIAVEARDHAATLRFFDGMTLVDPGVTQIHRWRPDGIQPPHSWDLQVPGYAALAHKP